MPPSRIGADVMTNATTLTQKSAPSRAAKPARGSSASSVASTASSRLTAVRRTRSTVVMRVDYAPESRSLDRAHESIRSRVGHRRETRRAAPNVPFARYFAGAQRAPAVVDSVIHWSTRFHGVDFQPEMTMPNAIQFLFLFVVAFTMSVSDALAEPPAKTKHVGYLVWSSYGARGNLEQALIDGMRDEGYVEGKNL